jgi:hypothetical protein
VFYLFYLLYATGRYCDREIFASGIGHLESEEEEEMGRPRGVIREHLSSCITDQGKKGRRVTYQGKMAG